MTLWRKIGKVILAGIVVVVAFILLVILLLYTPPVQQWVKGKVLPYVHSATGLDVSLDRILLEFPLTLRLEGVKVVEPLGDTLFSSDWFEVNVAFEQLSRRRVHIRHLALENGRVRYKDTLSGFAVDASIGRLALHRVRIALTRQHVRLASLELERGTFSLHLGEATSPDTTRGDTPLDWSIVVNEIVLKSIAGAVEGASLGVLHAGGEELRLSRGEVHLGEQRVELRSLFMDAAYCDMMIPAVPLPEPYPLPEVSSDTSAWQVRAGEIQVERGRFSMTPGGELAIFPRKIAMEAIAVQIDDLYNRGMEVSADIRRGEAREQGGLSLRQLTGKVELLKERMALTQFTLNINNTRLNMEASVEAGLDDFTARTPLRLALDGTISSSDVALFLPDSLLVASGLWEESELITDILLDGSLACLNVRRLDAGIAPDFSFSGKGKCLNVADMEQLSGEMDFALSLMDVARVDSLLTAYSGGQWRLPPLELEGQLVMQEGKVALQAEIRPEKGRLQVDASYGLRDTTYALNLSLHQFDLDGFFPLYSPGQATASLTLSGQGIDLEHAEAKTTFRLDTLFYRDSLYRGVSWNATLAEGVLNGRCRSNIPDLNLQLRFQLSAHGQDYTAALTGRVNRLSERFLQHPPGEEDRAFSLGVALEGSWRGDKFSLQTTVSDVIIETAGREQNFGDLTLRAGADTDSTWCCVEAGDLRLALDSGEGWESWFKKGVELPREVTRQLESRDVNMDSLRAKLPDFRLAITGKRENIISRYLYYNGLYCSQFQIDMEAPPHEEISLHAVARGVAYEEFRMDSVTIRLRQRGAALRYMAQVQNASEFLEDFALFLFSGRVEGNELMFRTRELDREGKSIVAIGASIHREDDMARVILNDTLVLGYVPWKVNPENYIHLGREMVPSADIRLFSGEKHITLLSGKDEEQYSTLEVDVQHIDLELLSKSFSFLPEMSGDFSTRIHANSRSGITLAGEVWVDDFHYAQKRVGKVGLELGYQYDKKQLHSLLSLDEQPAIKAGGYFDAEKQGEFREVEVAVLQIPTRLLEAFLPVDVLSMEGVLTGNLTLNGTASAPLLNGELLFRETSLRLKSLGTSFVLDNRPLQMRDNLIRLGKWGIVAPNGQRLELDGSLEMTSFTGIKTDISMKARKFQVLKAKSDKESLVGGEAYVDVDLTARGSLDAVVVRGNIQLLDNSVINYTLRDSPLELNDRSTDLVRFVSFRDTLFGNAPRKSQVMQRTQTDMLVSLGVSPLVGINVHLSESGSSGVFIQGGGDLIFSMNDMGDVRLVGRYSPSSGTVIYSLPVMGEKKFTIQGRNYVEWTGRVASPILQIAASERVNATIRDENEHSRLVVFNSMIRIAGSLDRPEITFDLTTSGDVNIQNQLAAMSVEERSREAMNVLIYGTYTGPGVAGSSNTANNALINIVERELNNWSRRNLKGVELTFGIDTYEHTTELGHSQRTDYSYQLSKRMFNNRVNARIGGRISTDDDPTTRGMEENLVDDISIEYMFTKNPNYFLKVFRHTGYESILEGEITRTGLGIVIRKRFAHFWDIFGKKEEQ